MYVCQNCGFHSPKWFGKCPSCESWNTLQYEEEKKGKKKVKKWEILGDDTKGEHGYDTGYSTLGGKPIPISDILSASGEKRIKTGLGEFDRVLGGGIVSGAIFLLAGEPGVGKSTLLLQVALSISKKGKVLYISSEESPLQIGIRVKRLCGYKSSPPSSLFISFQGCIENALADARDILSSKSKGGKDEGMSEKDKSSDVEKENGDEHTDNKLLILDAVQSFFSDEIESAPGSVSQVREITSKALQFARETSVPVFLVGHITKEGVVAGPKVLEHIVDVVLYVESEGIWRIVRATKNRFGSTGEIGLFTMTEKGLSEVSDPSTAFIDEDILGTPGAVLSAVLEGTRIYIVEVQALVSKTHFSVPRRVAQGYDLGRLNTLLAVLEKHGGLSFWDKDVFLNIAGGMRVSDVAVDLAVALAILSSYYGVPLGKKVAFGEVGLLGEVRTPSLLEHRVKELDRIKPNEIITGKAKVRSGSISSVPSIKELIMYVKKLRNKEK